MSRQKIQKSRLMLRFQSMVSLPDDSEEERLRKAILLIFGILMSMGGLVWGFGCILFGLYYESLLPFGYTVCACITMTLFVLTKKFEVFSNIQLALSLLLPIIFQWMVGGFVGGSAVMFWALIAPVAAQFFGGIRKSIYWFIAFVILTIAVSFAEVFYPSPFGRLPESANLPGFFINITVVSAIVFLTGLYFYSRMESLRNKVQETLQRVQEMKERQDGDYFLTSLLLEPLSQNSLDCGDLCIQFAVRQKKTFSFRRRDKEIGGDYCTVRKVKIGAKTYAFFINADAMGKSMQGAGGALVLGSGLTSILTAAENTTGLSRKTPERWMSDVYSRIHNLFLTFDGSMLVSLIMGLVDPTNGFMYYINAEHPYPAVLRNGRAEFIERDITFRKTGMPGADVVPHVRTFRMMNDDIVVVGSDGRDDVIIDKGDGTTELNHDENLFLRHMEESGGEPEKLINAISQTGELSDDIAILSINFHTDKKQESSDGNAIEALQHIVSLREQGLYQEGIDATEEWIVEQSFDEDIIKEGIRCAVKLQDHEALEQFCLSYLHIRPDDTEMLYLASYAQKMLKKYQFAIRLAERACIREPDRYHYLANIAEIALHLEMVETAEEYLIRARTIDESDPKIVRLQSYLESTRRKMSGKTA